MAFLNDGGHNFQCALTVELKNPNLGTGGDIENTNDATAKAPLGALFRYKGNIYRYVQFDNGTDNIAAAQYGVVHWKERSNTYPVSNDRPQGAYIVTSDYSSGLGANMVAGIIGMAVTDQYYTWIQVGGVATAFVAAGNAIGDMQISGNTDLYFAHVDVGGAWAGNVVGVALTAVSSNKSSILLRNLF